MLYQCSDRQFYANDSEPRRIVRQQIGLVCNHLPLGSSHSVLKRFYSLLARHLPQDRPPALFETRRRVHIRVLAGARKRRHGLPAFRQSVAQTVRATSYSTIAFFVHFAIVGCQTGNSLPVVWFDMQWDEQVRHYT